MKKKKVVYIFIFCIIVVFLGLVSYEMFSLPKATQEVKSKEENKVSFLAVGDIIAHDSVNKNAYNSEEDTYNYDDMFLGIKTKIQNADIAFANQETISTSSKDISGYPSFNAPFSLIDGIANTGFDLISIANNHATDINNTAPNETTKYYEKNYPNIKVSGSNDSCEDMGYQKFDKNGISFTFNAFTYGVNNSNNLNDCNINVINDENYKDQIKDLTSDGDVNIVSLHFGEENVCEISEQEQQIVDKLLDSGVEIILGTHPHILKPIVQTTNSEGNDAIVAYSLGNFLSTQLEDNQRIGGMLEFDISLENKVNIDNVKFTPTYQYYTWEDENEEDLDSRRDVKIIYLPEISQLESFEYYNELVDIVKEVIDEKYLTYLPTKPYDDISYINSEDFNELSVVNKHTCLQSDYEPNDLVIPDVLLSTRTGEDVHYISSSIEKNIKELFSAASEKGYDLVFVSGYRSYKTQQSLYNNYVNSDTVKAADTYSARPGCSEHQTGIGFDISEQSIDANGVSAFNGTDASKWVKENAHKYGFIIRYPQNKVGYTQYTYESWHLRYVGEQAATYMYKNDLSLEEYNYNQKNL